MDKHDVTAVMSKPISQELLASAIPARLAYVGVDGDPRVIPIGYVWTGSDIVMFTVPKSAKVRALQQNPRVAITVDTEGFPPHVLLIRGKASLTLMDGVPDQYVEAARRVVSPEQFDDWESGVRALYDQMVRITVELDWAKLLDFETTIPKAVEDLVRARQGR
ncbi:MAG TPA: pyridoxamine 5'-phosphate oxidase family protein [Actinopolymorphaceae bacterium]|nr:pyridoxamine 5'-phosphate oxidase family protein [Actinopolymorphaceae bacterium]